MYRQIELQIIDEETEKWKTLFNLHAKINKKSNGNEYLEAGSERTKVSLVFEVRYFSGLKDIAMNTSLYRIVYDDNIYNIVDYDDYKEKHKKIKLLGVYSG